MAIAGDVAKKYVSTFKDTPTRTLARKMFNENPNIFRTVDVAAERIRYYRGNSGDKSRKNCTDKSNFRKNRKSGYIPKGVSHQHKPVIVNQPGSYLILADIHAPYHDEQALELAIERGLKEGCTGVILNGDSIDFYQLSRFNKDPRERSPKEEVETLKLILKQLSKRFKNRYYKFGNHEDRWEHLIFEKHPYLADFEEMNLGAVLGLDGLNYRQVPSKQYMKLSGLNLLHGHEVPRGISTSVNPARTLWLRVKETAMVAHHHRSSQHNENHPMKGKITCTWSIGCLCDLHPTWNPLNEWNLGFAIVEISPKRFEVQNYLIQSGTVYEI